MSRLSKLEQETIIRFDEQESEAEIYTHNKAMKKRLSGLCQKHPDQFRFKSDNGSGGLTYTIPKKRITITAPRKLTPEQKEKAKLNLKK